MFHLETSQVTSRSTAYSPDRLRQSSCFHLNEECIIYFDAFLTDIEGQNADIERKYLSRHKTSFPRKV